MNVTVTAPTFGGTIRAIASKSSAHRLLICAALSDAPCEIFCSDFSDDIFATANCLRALGAEITAVPDGFAVKPIDRAALPTLPELDCGESGSTLRFLLPVVAALGCGGVFRLGGRLPDRPLSPLYELLTANGVMLSATGQPTLTMAGKLQGNQFSIPGNVSSQFISGLLFALPLLGGGSVTVEGTMESAGYVELTRRALAAAGVTVTDQDADLCVSGSYHLPARCEVEGDWSNAAVWLAAGAIGKQPVTVTGLDPESAQGDRAIASLLQQFGAGVTLEGMTYTVTPAPLHGIRIDARQIPDLVPVLAAVAAAAEGETVIYGAARLRIKESDRLASTCSVLTGLGADIWETEDGLIIHGTPLHGGEAASWNDHRIVMMAALCSLRTADPVQINGSEAVRKSYPAFLKDFTSLGGSVQCL